MEKLLKEAELGKESEHEKEIPHCDILLLRFVIKTIAKYFDAPSDRQKCWRVTSQIHAPWLGQAFYWPNNEDILSIEMQDVE